MKRRTKSNLAGLAVILLLMICGKLAAAGEREILALRDAGEILGVKTPQPIMRNQLAGIELRRQIFDRNQYVELAERGGIKIKGVEGGSPGKIASDEVWVRLYGPTESSPPCDRLTTSKSRSMPTSWGGTVEEDYFALSVTDTRESKSPSPFSGGDDATPAWLRWVWGYEQYCVEIRWSIYAEKRSDELRPFVARLAEAVHKGMVEQGLTGRVQQTFEVRIEIPPDLKPGDVLSPSAVVADQFGKPPKNYSYNLLINGQFTRSIVWDGKETTIEAQVSIVEPGHQAMTKTIVLPAYGTAPPPDPVIPIPPGLPGMGGIGAIPGPTDPLQAILGIAIPTIIGAIGSVLEGLFGGGKGVQAPPEVREGADRLRAASDRLRQGAAAAEKPTLEPKEPKLDANAQRAQKTLDRLREVAKNHRDSNLATAVRMAGGAIGKDGKLDPQKWDHAKESLRNAIDQLSKNSETPSSWLGDALRETAKSPIELGKMAGGAVWNGVKGIAVGGYEGTKQIADAVWNWRHFKQGAEDRFRDWTDKYAQADRQAFLDALRKNEPLDALKALGNAGLKAGGQMASGVWNFIKRDILPVDEADSILHPNSTEEFCWGVAAGATKIASILTIFVKPTNTPSTFIGKSLEGVTPQASQLTQLESELARKASQLENRLKVLEKTAPAPGGASRVQAVIDKTRTALDKTRISREVCNAASKVEELTQKALANQPPILNFPDAQRRLAQAPELRTAIDKALKTNRATDALFDQRAIQVISKDAHTLMTARKLELQQHVVNNASKRILQEELAAMPIKDVPNRMHTFNATQGSRTQISGANVNADFDQTLLGLKRVPRERVNRIITEECAKLGISQEALDINIYQPVRGVSDAAGAAANAPPILENIGQTTGTAGYHPVYKNPKTGEIIVGDHVAAQGREGVMAARASLDPPPGMSREDWLRSDYVWEGHQGKPIAIPPALRAEVLAAQVKGIQHAGDVVKVAKYANRGAVVGLNMTDATRELCKKVVGQKDPAIAIQILEKAGIKTRDDFVRRLGLQQAQH